jgi:hypothetical protein
MTPLTASKTPPSDLEKAILSTLLYYDLLNCPLTALEIFKYLSYQKGLISFFQFGETLKQSKFLSAACESNQGLYFLKNRRELIDRREKKLKISQIKWKKLKAAAKPLAFIPFLRLAGVSGSLTFNNASQQSDFDLLIITQPDRIWTTRIMIMAIFGIMGKRRHGSRTKNRFCLNCYLTENNLEIKKENKIRDMHSSQEYGRLTLLLEKKTNLHAEFLEKNSWLKNFLNNYPWPNSQTAKRISVGRLAQKISYRTEKILSGNLGNWLEKKLGGWQTKRIKAKTKNEPTDQIFYSDSCLMFHPQSKSYILMEEYNEKMRNLTSNFQNSTLN